MLTESEANKKLSTIRFFNFISIERSDIRSIKCLVAS